MGLVDSIEKISQPPPPASDGSPPARRCTPPTGSALAATILNNPLADKLNCRHANGLRRLQNGKPPHLWSEAATAGAVTPAPLRLLAVRATQRPVLLGTALRKAKQSTPEAPHLPIEAVKPTVPIPEVKHTANIVSPTKHQDGRIRNR